MVLQYIFYVDPQSLEGQYPMVNLIQFVEAIFRVEFSPIFFGTKK